jgi:hypothetical protein
MGDVCATRGAKRSGAMVDARLRFAAANLADIKKPEVCASLPGQ